MSNDNTSTHYGITFWGLLQVMFIGLKITGMIDWPWWQVFLPLIIECAVIVVVFIFMLMYAFRD